MLIIARTDAYATHGLDETLRRLEAYRDAGADIIYADGLPTVEAMKAVCAIPGVYKFGNQVEGGKSPTLSFEELQEIGYDIVIYPVGTAFAAERAIENYLKSLKENHSNKEIIASGSGPGFAEFNAAMGMEALTDMEKKFQVDVFKKRHSEENG